MIPYRQALQIILQHTGVRKTEKLPLLSAHSRISAAEITSAMQVPSFCNSAMDGFAVRCADIAGATVEQPIALPIMRTIAAGDVVTMETASGASQIMTGAPVPEPYDAVIPVEEVMVAGDEVSFMRPAREHENIRFPGEDVRLGQRVLRRNETIATERVMLLAAVGVAEVEVYQLPALHILSTGKEITDNAGAPLPEGRIYNSNAPYLIACCREEGFTPEYGGIIADDPAAFEQAIASITPGSVIITTGAVSKGTWDFIPESLKHLGATTHFHRVNIRPGKPVLFATLPNGSWFFGLPGNPVSAAIGFRFFVLPLLWALQGLEPEQPLMARLENGFIKKGNFRQFLKSRLSANAKGELVATVSSGQESFKISPVAESNAWVMLEEDRLECKAGTMVSVLPFRTQAAEVLAAQPMKEAPLCRIA